MAEHTTTPPGEARPSPARRWPQWSWGGLLVVLGAVAAAAVVAWQFLSLYPERGFATPIANDTLKYIWRSNLAQAAGLHAIAGVPAATTVSADRPGFPVVAAVVHSVLVASPFRFAFVVPAVTAVIIGLAAGALMTSAVDEPRWSFPVYVLAVGGSVNVTLMSVGYGDNLMVSGVLVAGATCALLAADGRRGVVATGVLLAGAALVHWQFTGLFVAILLGLAVLLVPESVLAIRRGTRAVRTPSARMGAGVLAGAAVGAGLLLVLAPGSPDTANTNRGSFLQKLARTRDAYRFGVAGPVAAEGAIAVAVPPRARRLRGLALLVGWGMTAAGGYWALRIARMTVPAHRLIAFALAIPMLGAAAVVGVARALGWVASALGRGRERRPGAVALRVAAAVVGGAVVAAAVVWGVAVARGEWFDRARPVMRVPGLNGAPVTEAGALAEAATAGRYVARDGGGRPVVYIVGAGGGAGGGGAVAAAGIIRDGIPPDQLPTTAFYVGEARLFLRGIPFRSDFSARANLVSMRFWQGARPFAKDAIAIELLAFNPALAKHGRPEPGGWIAKGVWLVRGPQPSGPIQAAPAPRPPSWPSLALLTFGIVALVGAAGSGWSFALLDADPGTRAALAPAFGVATIAIGGAVADRAGLRLRGVTGIAVAVAVTAVGWVLWWLVRPRADATAPDATAPDETAPTAVAPDAIHPDPPPV